MNLQSRHRNRAAVLKVLLILAAVLVSGLVLAGATLVRSLRMPSPAFPDFAAEVISKLELKIRSDVEINAPPLVFTLARLGSHCVKVEPEVRSAMHTVRSAHVGVYELTDRPTRRTQLDLIKTLDKRCAALGWQRTGCVIDHQDLVLVYLPDTAANKDEVQVFVMVLSDSDLVAVGAIGDVDSLSDLINTAMKRHRTELLAALH
jgi:hypothetical protein